MSKIDAPKNLNYAAQIVRVPAVLTLPGLDNLVGVPILGHQALTQKDGVGVGDLKVAFTAETQLGIEYSHNNNLFRHADLNEDPTEAGYLEDNRRIKAISLRKHKSNALLMPLSSLEWTGVDLADLNEGVTFDTLNGHLICQKYELPVKEVRGQSARIDKAFKRVDKKLFPEHLDTDSYFRAGHVLNPENDVVVTQKLHGTSFRAGRVPVLRDKKWFERLVNRLPGITTPDVEHDVVFGSRKVIKDPNNPAQNHYYATSGDDLWTAYGKQIAELIPEGYMVYGELIGWTEEGSPLQKGYTYHLPIFTRELYVYRVATMNAQGLMSDLSWDGVKEFCVARGLKTVPELTRTTVPMLQEFLQAHLDTRLADSGDWTEPPLTVSNHKTVDEGVCFRQEGLVPRILKCKSQIFLQHESSILDEGVADIESAA